MTDFKAGDSVIVTNTVNNEIKAGDTAVVQHVNNEYGQTEVAVLFDRPRGYYATPDGREGGFHCYLYPSSLAPYRRLTTVQTLVPADRVREVIQRHMDAALKELTGEG